MPCQEASELRWAGPLELPPSRLASTVSWVTSPSDSRDGPPSATVGRLRIHLGLLVCVVICATGFVIELQRALSGNTLSWAYVAQWPIFVVAGVYLWWRLLHDDPTKRRPSAPSPEEDANREAWNRYLADLHASEEATKQRRGNT